MAGKLHDESQYSSPGREDGVANQENDPRNAQQR